MWNLSRQYKIHNIQTFQIQRPVKNRVKTEAKNIMLLWRHSRVDNRLKFSYGESFATFAGAETTDLGMTYFKLLNLGISFN